MHGHYGPFLQNVQAQGAQFNQPLAPDERYYGLLCKADYDEDTQRWSVFFELVNKQFLDNVLFSRAAMLTGAALPPMPALAFQLLAVEQSDLLTALGLRSTSEIVEGSWYELQLADEAGAPEGRLYDPDVDLGGPRPEGI